MTDLMRTRPMTADEIREVLKRTGDEAFMTPAERIAFRREIDVDQADRPRFLRGQRRRRAYYWLRAFCRYHEVTLWAALITGLFLAWVFVLLRSIR